MAYMTVKVGPKGQVVLPSDFRKVNHIVPGETVLLNVNVIPTSDILKTMEEMPKIDLGELDSHEAYEDQMRHRERKRQKRLKK